jgi:hypothetical protein
MRSIALIGFAGVIGRSTRGLHLVRIRDVAFAVLGFQLFLSLVGAAGLHGNGRLTDIGEGGKGFISLHVAISVGCSSDQVLMEFESVNRNRNRCRNAIAGQPSK